MIQHAATSACTLVSGMQGSGKTTFALRYLVATGTSAHIFLFDPRGDLAERLKLAPAETEPELWISLDDGITVFDPAVLFPGQRAAGFEWFCAWVSQACAALPGRKVFFIDEVWKFCSPHSIPLSLAECVQDGRKLGLEMMFATQRPNKLNGSITGEVTELVCFRLQESNALATLAELGADLDRVRALPLGSFVSFDCLTRGTASGRVF